MGLFDFVSDLLVDPVDTSGARRAVNESSAEAQDLFAPNIAAGDDIRNMLLKLFTDQGAFQGTDAFQFALDQGVAARDKSAAAAGQLGSGNQQKELTAFGTGLANQDRGNELNRLLAAFSQFNPARTQSADVALNRGKNIAGIDLGAENARVASSGSLLNGVLGLGGAIGGNVLGRSNNLTKSIGLF